MQLKPDSPDISVIIPCFNAQDWIKRAVASILEQSYLFTEIIVVDDGSSDNSVETVAAMKADISVVSMPHKGACAARNKGLELARGKYVMFLDADDFLKSGMLSRLFCTIEESAADLVIGRVYEASSDGSRRVRELPRLETVSSFVADWITCRFVPPAGLLWRASFIRSIGGWNDGLKKNQDGEVVMRAAVSGAKIVTCEEVVACYWVHDGPFRISNSVDGSKLRDSFLVLHLVWEKMNRLGVGDAESDVAFSIAMHGLERMAYRNFFDEVGDEISCARQKAGFPLFEGTKAHIFLSSIFGVRRKEKMARLLRSLRVC